MTSLVLTAIAPTSPTPALQVGPAAAIAPLAPVAPIGFAAMHAELPSPGAGPASSAQNAPIADNTDGAAMRPDQLFMSRQLSYQRADAPTLASGWRSMVRQYGSALVERELRTRGGMLPPTLMVTSQEGRLLRTPDSLQNADPWRFTVHAGGLHQQELRVLGRAADPPPGRRKRARVALRLELTLDDGTRVAVQLEPMPGGVALDLAAPGREALERLRRLEPMLDAAIERVGLRVLRRSYSQSLAPAMSAHASLAAMDATSVLTLPVFRAMAELALLLPACALAPLPALALG